MPNTLPTGATSWQLSLPSSAPPEPMVRRQGLLPPRPLTTTPICIWGKEGAWRQSRGAGELLRGHMSFSLLLSPLPGATFPSYDLCFPSLPVKGGDWQKRGFTIQAGCLEVGVGKEVRMVTW